MIPKTTKLRFADELSFFHDPSPISRYANADFRKGKPSRDARYVVLWVERAMPYQWSREQIHRYLQQHQTEFRECLKWLLDDATVQVDEGGDSSEVDLEDEHYFRELWEKNPNLKFLRQHGLQHAGITLVPEWQEGPSLSGLMLDQRKPKDPLDPICWFLLWWLSFYGSIPLRCCPHCRKFFNPPTSRKRFCSDSCRALNHAWLVSFNAWENGTEDRLRASRRRKMREYRANPLVKKRSRKS